MVFNKNGIFSKATQTTDKYGKTKARETLELALGEAQTQKYESGLSEEQLNSKITAIDGELMEKEKPENPNLQNVIVDGHIFEIDRSVPKIVDYISPADGVIITANINGNNNGWFKQGEIINVTVTGKIKTYSGGTITNVTATKGEAAITDFSIDSDGKYTIDNITEGTTIIINAKDSNNKESSKTIPIIIRVDGIVPTLSSVTAKAEARRIKIKGEATDNESGIKQINYSVTPTTVNSATGTLLIGQEITLTATTSEEYTITFTGEDNAGNLSTPQSKTVETVGVIKHINTSTGLKEVNTADIYGADVQGYTCDRSDTEWQLFYIDEEDNHRAYLISKDYAVPPIRNAEPKLLAGGNDSYPKAYRFGTSTSDTSILGSFTGALPNKENTTEMGKFMTKYLNEFAGADASSQANLQVINYMLAQNTWGEYKNNAKADLVFGGPTLPLFIASYNDTSGKQAKLGYQKNGAGYQIRYGTGIWTTSFSGGSLGANSQKGIYYRGDDHDFNSCMWITSPSGQVASNDNGSRYVFGVGKSWISYMRLDSSKCGFRIIVALKSNIQFINNGDGTYTIK